MGRERTEFITGLKSLLKYHEAIGIGEYPYNEDVKSFLQKLPERHYTDSATPEEKTLRRNIPSRKSLAEIPESPVTLAEIAEEVAVCHACELHKQRLYPVAGRGAEKIRLLIVGDWLTPGGEEQLPPDQLFGVEQDRMLSRMLSAINLLPTEVFITNVIKCAIPGSCQPKAGHVKRCVSFLRRQIVVLRPELICTMGMVAARAVLAKPQPLSQLRGTLHDYEVEKNVIIPVLTTYHPTYLLQNPEMKQATWQDLQFLARQLGLKLTG